MISESIPPFAIAEQLTNSVLQYSEKYGVYVDSPNHYLSGNSFSDITSYAVYNADTSNMIVQAEGNYWGDENGPDPYGSGEKIQYRTCYDSELEISYICQYYTDADPWLGKDTASSGDLIDEKLPDEPIRNTASMEAGIPYIVSVESSQQFFYYSNKQSDTLIITVDWNGSEPGQGEAGYLIITVNGIDHYIEDVTESGGRFNVPVSELAAGYSEIMVRAHIIPNPPDVIQSEVVTIRVMRFLAPEWLSSLEILDVIKFEVTENPDYTEAKFSVTIPGDAKNIILAPDNVPVVSDVSIPELELKYEFVIRSDGQGYLKGKSKICFDEIDMGRFEGDAYVYTEGKGLVQLPWYGEGLRVDGTLEAGVEGEIKYRESILVFFPGLSQTLIASTNLPILGSMLHDVLDIVYIEGKVEPEMGISTTFSADFQNPALNWEGLNVSDKVKMTATVGIEVIEDTLEANVYGGGP